MQSISVITLGVADLARSRHFYTQGFWWTPVFENDQIIFYQLNGVVLGTFLTAALEEDMQRSGLQQRGAFALAQNVTERDAVTPLLDRLVAARGSLLRAPRGPPHGGFRGYVADPGEHAWEVAWMPVFIIDEQGNVTFGA